MSTTDKGMWYNWYKNIVQYFKYRDETPDKILSKEEVVREMINNNMVHIKNKKIHVILTYPGQKFSNISADSKKKITDILNKDEVDELMYLADITFVGDKGQMFQESVKKMITDLKHINNRIWVQIRPYTIFTMDILASTESVKHKRIDQEKVKKDLEETMTPITSLPRIKEWDPQVVWIGGKAGEIISVERLSGSVGYQSILRKIVL